MLKVVRDLLRHNREFAIGVALLAIVIAVAATSLLSPYPPEDSYVVPPDIPPSSARLTAAIIETGPTRRRSATSCASSRT